MRKKLLSSLLKKLELILFFMTALILSGIGFNYLIFSYWMLGSGKDGLITLQEPILILVYP